MLLCRALVGFFLLLASLFAITVVHYAAPSRGESYVVVTTACTTEYGSDFMSYSNDASVCHAATGGGSSDWSLLLDQGHWSLDFSFASGTHNIYDIQGSLLLGDVTKNTIFQGATQLASPVLALNGKNCGKYVFTGQYNGMDYCDYFTSTTSTDPPAAGGTGDYWFNYMGLTCGTYGALYCIATYFDIIGCNNGLKEPNGCACNSNYYPVGNNQNCDGVGTCASLPSVSPMTTQNVGSLDIYEITGGVLHLRVLSDMFNNRVVQSISLNGGCSYPGTYWTKSVNSTSCQDVFDSSVSTPALLGCFTWDSGYSDPSVYRYTSSLTMKVIDDVGQLRGTPITRTTVSSIDFEMLVQKLVNVTATNIIVSPGLDVQIAITGQFLNVEDSSLLLQFTTSVDEPYVLTGGALDAITIVETSSGCPDPTGYCTQTWNATMTLDMGCDFSGIYNGTFSADCRSGIDFSCPQNASALTATFQATIEEANLCNTGISIVSGASATIGSYSDATLGTPKAVFLQGDTIYLEVVASADLPLAQVSLDDVVAVGPSGPVTLLSGCEIESIGIQANFSSTTGTSDASCSFVLTVGEEDTDLFNLADVESVFSFDVEVVATLEYSGQFRKRSVETVRMTLTQHLTGITSAVQYESFA